jgi:hypothetical protein
MKKISHNQNTEYDYKLSNDINKLSKDINTLLIDNPNKDEYKCAPNKIYYDGSCFSLESLIKIAKKYNDTNNDKIDITESKENLVKILNDKLSDYCKEQTCWLKLNIIKELEDEEINYNTFKPLGPINKYEWLNTNHINQVIHQYHVMNDDFIFLGTVPYDFEDLPILGFNEIKFDELYKNNKIKIGLVINLDEHYKSGSHWVGLFANLKKNQIYYFDSTGRKPLKRIRKFINRIIKFMYNRMFKNNLSITKLINDINKNKNNISFLKKYNELNNILSNFDIRYNNIQHQFKNSECGVYSIHFIIKLVNDNNFDDVINNIINDDDMHKYRNIFFRNVHFTY